MLRCEICSGYATAGLAHLHGLSAHLCVSCTREALKHREKNEAIDSFKARLSRIGSRLTAGRSDRSIRPQRRVA